MKKSGAVLREVGTTNRTYIEDFERAIGDNTGLIMKAHTSNYRIRGFTHEVSSDELVALGKRYNTPPITTRAADSSTISKASGPRASP
jgi:L-seryl-tRNA(Ser) seleniumtransferase